MEIESFCDVCCSQAGSKTAPESRCPELLARYCDMLLRKSTISKKQTSEDIERNLKEVVCMSSQALVT
jgi:hypothetical protein